MVCRTSRHGYSDPLMAVQMAKPVNRLSCVPIHLFIYMYKINNFEHGHG